MIPGWKFRREIGRVINQIREIPARLSEPLLRWTYERNRWTRIKVHGESASVSRKLCVFLVYQPKSLSPSILATINFLSAKGYSILLVANSGLPDEMRSLVLSKVWRLMERPNFGYDFGGFRDAIHYLEQQNIHSSHLILLNDSIWFPMSFKTTIIERLEASVFDLTGLFLHVPARNELEKEGRRIFKKRKLAEHIESYLTMIPEATLARPEFRKFWLKYRQTSSKTQTIRRGEIGFSKAMAAAGMKVGALSRRTTFLEGFGSFTDSQMERSLIYAAYSDKNFEDERDMILAAERGPSWRGTVLDHVQRVVERRRFNASFCWATEEIFDSSFQKKHQGEIFKNGRKRFLEAVDNGDLECDNHDALEELRCRVTQDFSAVSLEGQVGN